MQRLILLAALSCAAQAETVYRCAQSGGTLYTDTAPQSACTPLDLSGQPFLSLDRPSEKPAARPQNGRAENNAAKQAAREEKARRQAQAKREKARQAAEHKLAKAEAALEKGKTVRYGNEKNHDRRQERIAKLEQAVETAKQDLAKLQ